MKILSKQVFTIILFNTYISTLLRSLLYKLIDPLMGLGPKDTQVLEGVSR